MTKKDLVKKILPHYPDLDFEVAAGITDAFFEVLKETLSQGSTVELRGFGRFEPRVGKGVIFTNPKNHQKYYVKEKRRVIFRNGLELLRRLNLPFDAGLDLGTQTFRLILGKLVDGKPVFLLRDKVNVRLGEKVCETRMISEKSYERGLSALAKFKETLNNFKIREINPLGTAVFRKAKNAEEFVATVEKILGFKIKVLLPEEEAELTLKGINFGLNELGLKPTSYVVVDLGGGSTEVIHCRVDHNPIVYSLDLGVVTLKDFFSLRYPLTGKIIQSLRDYIKDKLRELPKIQPDMLVITGGSASLIGSLDLKLTSYFREALHGHWITLDRLGQMAQRLLALTLTQLAKVRGMERGREDLIGPALCVYLELLSYFNLSEAIVSECGILEGTLLSLWGL